MVKAKSQIIKVVRAYLKEVESVCHVDKAILFGSCAHGKITKHSDIDVAIFSRKVNDRNRLEIMSKALLLIGKFGLDIQPVVFPYKDYAKNDSTFVAEEIKKKGIVISATR